jgi:hypothetical protein
MEPQSFFIADGDGFRATDLTRGPWSPELQHAGPPSALLARAVERALPQAPELTVARLTVELIRPIPVARFTTRVTPLRTGRKVQWLTADLLGPDGALVARAGAVCIRTAQLALPVSGDPASDPVPLPAESKPFRFDFFQSPVGYHTGMELRLARGAFGAGRIAVWMRMRAPLVAGEPTSPLQRVLIAADSGNGVSMVLDPKRFTFVNPDLTVHLHRMPEGEWVCLDARTIPQARGVGLADTRLLDEQGPIGRSAQSLIIEARG